MSTTTVSWDGSIRTRPPTCSTWVGLKRAECRWGCVSVEEARVTEKENIRCGQSSYERCFVKINLSGPAKLQPSELAHVSLDMRSSCSRRSREIAACPSMLPLIHAIPRVSHSRHLVLVGIQSVTFTPPPSVDRAPSRTRDLGRVRSECMVSRATHESQKSAATNRLRGATSSPRRTPHSGQKRERSTSAPQEGHRISRVSRPAPPCATGPGQGFFVRFRSRSMPSSTSSSPNSNSASKS